MDELLTELNKELANLIDSLSQIKKLYPYEVDYFSSEIERLDIEYQAYLLTCKPELVK